MKIAILHPSFASRGGAENVVHWLASALHERGHEVSLFSGHTEKLGQTGYTAIPVHINVRVHHWPGAARLLARKLPEYDLVNPHNFPATLLVWLARIWRRLFYRKSRRTFPPVLWYCHEPPEKYYGKNASQYRRRINRRWRRWYKPAHTFDNLERLLDLRAVQSVDRIYCNSRATADFTRAIYHRRADVLYPGLPAERFPERLPPRQEQRENFILIVARLFKVKNIETALNALKLLQASKNPEARSLRLKIAGTGHDHEYFTRRADELGIHEAVEFCGFVPDDELLSLYRNARAVLNISLDEPFGLIALEALSFEAPLINSKSAGAGEIIEDGRDGLLVDPLDEHGIAEKLLWLLANPQKAAALGRAGRKKVEEHFLFSHYTGSFIEKAKQLVHDQTGQESVSDTPPLERNH